MRNIIVVNFEQGKMEANAYDKVWQYDYGQTLRIQGLKLPRNVEIHFATQRTGGIAIPRVGVTRDGVTDVVIPDSMLENGDATSDYPVYAFVYLTDETSGQTEYMIRMQVKSRPRPEVPGGSEDPGAFHEVLQEVRKLTEKATESERQAEGWAHGREDLPERAQDNAKYYAGKTSEDAKKTAADRIAAESAVQDATQMQGDVARDLEQVQKLTGQARTSATNAALSEQAAKTSETNAQTAQAGAETAEANAELAEQNAKKTEQAVEQAKQLVTQMGQEVLDNKNHVDQTVHNFDLTTRQALADVNNAGQTQTERVQNAGNTAVESVKTAQGTATQAVETAKTEVVQAVQTEGTTQTGNVTQEGEKQVQAVQQAAQEIVADREQIAQNKTGIEALKQGKADAIVETASGETIQVKDSSGLGFEGLRIFGKSTQDGTPTPENPVPIVNVGDKRTIEVGVSGKNLFDVKKQKLDSIRYDNGIYTGLDNDDADSLIMKVYQTDNTGSVLGKVDSIGIKSIGRYFLNAIKVENSNYIRFANSGKAREFSIFYPTADIENGKKITISFDVIDATVGMCKFSNVMLTVDDDSINYEPYQEPQTLTISTPNGLPGIKVDSDGNYTDENGQQWVCDEIDLERGKYVQRIAKYIFDGTEAGEDKYLPTIVVVMNTDGITGIHPGKIESNYGTINYSNSSGRGFGFKTMNWGVNGINELRQFMKNKYDSGDPVIAQYIAKEPIEHDLTPEEIAAYKALYTNYPTTVISNDESAHMEVSYVADTKNYIAKVSEPLQKQITELQNALISQKISGGGIKVTDSAKVPVVSFGMWGKTEQVKTTGAQLFDASKIPTIEEGEITLKYDGNGSLVLNGKGHVNVRYDYSHEATAKLLKPGKLTFLDKDNNNIRFMQACIFVDGKEVHTAYINGNAISLTEEELNNPTTFLQLLCYTIQSDATYNNVIFKPMLYQDGNGEWEPFTDGKPAPAPDNPAPIEVTDHPVTVTIKGGTEQQSITLVPPKPLTKWDKLEKVDGVWKWRYQSKTDKLVSFDSKFADEELSGETFCRYQSNINPGFSSKRTETLCTKLRNDKEEDSVFFNTLGAGYIVLYFNKKLGIDTLEKANNWIALNNDVSFTFYNVAKNLEYITLPQPVQDKLNALTMYAGTTEIINDGGCTMELTYTVDTKSYVDTKIAEISTAIVQKGI